VHWSELEVCTSAVSSKDAAAPIRVLLKKLRETGEKRSFYQMATEFMAQIPFLKKIEIFLRRSVKKKRVKPSF